MHLFNRLLLIALLVLGGILLWDLNQERLEYPGRQVIIYAGMFGPGEPMQQLYAGPAPATVASQPFGKDDIAHYRALAIAWPTHAKRIEADYLRIHNRLLPEPPDNDWSTFFRGLVGQYETLSPEYAELLVEALGQSDRGNRLRLFHAFAERHPQFDRNMIGQFEALHPAWTVGLFEDFERRHPECKIVARWDGRWVLSANRPRFLTGADVPDIIGGSVGELRILMRENLALALDQPIADAANQAWRGDGGIIAAEPSYLDPKQTFADDMYPWAIARSRYTVVDEDVRTSGNPYPVGREVLYLVPQEVRTSAIFYNKVHFRLIGRDGDDVPKTVAEFEDICRRLKQTKNPQTGKPIEPIANDGMAYMSMWWEWLVIRQIGSKAYLDTVMNGSAAGRFAGPKADPRYLEIARRLRAWRDDGFWMNGFSSSQWPAAQREFGNGRCTFLFTGTWLPAEIAGTMSRDREVFDLGCFLFPQVDGGSKDNDRIQVTTQGHCICRQGRNPQGAAMLLKYLVDYGGEPQVRKVQAICGSNKAPFPQAMRQIEPAMTGGRIDQFLPDGPVWYAPKFNKFVLNEVFPKFFLIRDDGLSPEQFVEEIERRAQEHYAQFGGTAR